jgi:hypothetical protein
MTSFRIGLTLVLSSLFALVLITPRIVPVGGSEQDAQVAARVRGAEREIQEALRASDALK